jgi:uncharacterized repeat protein (TIGR01451 family)
MHRSYQRTSRLQVASIIVYGIALLLLAIGLSATALASTPGNVPAEELPPYLTIRKAVSNPRPEMGQVVSITVTVTNDGPGTALSGTLLTESLTNGIAPIPASVSYTYGMAVLSGTDIQWTISGLAAAATASLTFQANVTAVGITTAYATVPGSATATACFTAPIHLCAGTPFEYELSAPASYTSYQWSRNGVPIAGATSAVLSVTTLGEYSLSANPTSGCPEATCCPFVLVEDAPPSLSAVGVAATCVGTTLQANAAISLVSSSTGAVSYNITAGSSFSATTPLFSTPQPLSAVAGGMLAAQATTAAIQPGGTYTIRVYTVNGCFADSLIMIPPTVCPCPPPRCPVYAVRRTKTGGQ